MLPRDGPAAVKRRLDYRPPAFLVDRVALELDLEPAATEVKATLAFRRNPAAAAEDRRAPLVLDGEQQDNIRVELDGRALSPAEAIVTAAALAIPGAPDAGTLVVRSRIAPERNVALEGLYVSSGVFCTQCEAEGFRRITCFPDRPDVLATYTVTLRADRARFPVLLSNGNLVAAGGLPGGRHFATWHDPYPKPSYLFALVAGDLQSLDDTYTTRSGRRVHLAIHSTAANIPRCHWAMESLKRAMRWDEERYGREYDLDRFMIFCADDFNFGAMENKGLNIFNSRLLLADPQTATDDDYGAIESVVGHEYFHNWTGNRVTCRDWFQLSLKEGLTVFRDQEFSGDCGSHAVERISAVQNLRRLQMPEDAGSMAHPVRPDEYQEINNFYTATVYEKGAEVIRMQHALLGPERFRRGMDLYFERHDGQAVTCDDFVQTMADASGVDLERFRRWYSQAGTPVVAARGRYDAVARTYTLELAQRTDPTPGQPTKLPFHIPFAVGLVGPDGRDLDLALTGDAGPPATTRVLDLDEPARAYTFVDVPRAPVPSLARGYSAPVRVEFDYTDDELALLASRHHARAGAQVLGAWKVPEPIVDVALPHATAAVPTYYVLCTAEAASNLARYDGIRYGVRVAADTLAATIEASRSAGFGAEVRRRILLGNFVLRKDSYEHYYGRAQRVRQRIADDYREAFAHCDVIASPTAPQPAFELGARVADPLAMYLGDVFTVGANLAGLPAISVPCGFSRGTPRLPIGLQLVGPRFREDLVLGAAALHERTGTWHRERPPLAAEAEA
jgi:aminopeptidase N